MADTDAYRERSQELFSEHVEFEDISLIYKFRIFLDDFEFAGYDKMLAGDVSDEVLAMMGIESDVKMSDQGLAKLHHAFLTEADEWTADLRKKEEVLEQLCAQLDVGDVLALNRTLNQAQEIWYLSKSRRYEELLKSLSPHDRAALDAVFFNRRAGKMFAHGPRMPVNANHIWDTLAAEFPDRVLEEAKRECEQYELNKGKHYVKVIERELSDPEKSGPVSTMSMFGTVSYELVDH